MHSKTLLAAVAGLAVVNAAPDALVTHNNIVGVSYKAVFPDVTKTSIRGYVASGDDASKDGTGVQLTVSLFGLPVGQAPFTYHVHNLPVPANGNCTATGEHLDPYEHGTEPTCDPSTPQQCQVGDLAGKHGKITTGRYLATYVDPYLSNVPSSNAFFGNRSIVVHNRNGTRLACANFALAAHVYSLNGTVASGSASVGLTAGAPTSTPTLLTSGAVAKAAGGSVALAGLLAFIW